MRGEAATGQRHRGTPCMPVRRLYRCGGKCCGCQCGLHSSHGRKTSSLCWKPPNLRRKLKEADEENENRTTVNGKLRHADVPPMKLLLAVLREDLRLTGSKGLRRGAVRRLLSDHGRTSRQRLLSAGDFRIGSEILTIEGLGSSCCRYGLAAKAFVSEGGISAASALPA